MKFYIGTSGYSYKEWQGIFYPEKISPHDMLRFYAGHLGAVEINNTFYRMPTEDVLETWTRQVPVSFVFAFKAPRIITHVKRLRNVGSEMQYLFRTLAVLHLKLGPMLFQLPASFRADADTLRSFLNLIPDKTPCAFEFRHPSWNNDEVGDFLRGRDLSLCTTDTDELPAQDIVRTASWGYLRLRRSDYSDADLASWLEKIRRQKWKTVFVFFKHEDKAKGPELAVRFKKLANGSEK